MMKRQVLSLLMCLVTVNVMWSQFTVKCVVKDSVGEGEPYASVRLYKASDLAHVSHTGVTDIDGNYNQALAAAGDYVMKITAVGKSELSKNFSVSAANPVADLGTLTLKDAGIELAGVTVTAQRALVKNEIDRLSYDVQADDDSKTNTVLEMLRKVPLVTVDGEDNIKVKGNSNFKIYKNGHPDPGISQNPKEVLKAIPASMIKRIEVITEPGAKYDAEGVTAILNIVLNDAGKVGGVTGTVNADVGTNGMVNGGAYITAQVGKLVTSLNYGLAHVSKKGSKSIGDSYQEYVASGNKQFTDSRADGIVNVHYGNFDASYEPDTLNLISASFGGYYYNVKSSSDINTLLCTSALDTISAYKTTSRGNKDSYYNFNGRADYEHKTHTKGEALTLSYMLSTSRSTLGHNMAYSDMVNMPVFYNGYNQKGKEKFIEHTFQFDWTRPFALRHKFETGVKYINRSNRSHTTMIYQTDTEGTYIDPVAFNVDSRFNHLTQVAAVYGSYTYTADKWSARAGLRYEYSYLSAKYPDGSQAAYHRNLNDWVPSASINYQFDWFNSLKFAFATRINRPGINFLNPAVISTPETESYGNSHLSSARNYSLSLTYMHIGPKFTYNIMPSYNFSSNQITSVERAEGNKKISTYDNTLTSRWAGTSAFVQWQATGTTSFMFNGNVGYNYYRSRELKLKNSGWDWFFWSQLTQRLPWNLRLSVGGGAWHGGVQSLYGESGTAAFYNISLQRSFLKDERLTVALTANRPFSGKYAHWESKTTQGDILGVSNQYSRQKFFGIRVSYRFGSLQTQVKKADKTIENNDVVGGASQGGNTGVAGGAGQAGQTGGAGGM